jgi:preprotein translocase subunit SecE
MTDVTVAQPGFAQRMRNAVASTKRFVREVVEEMRKVTWPDRPQLVQSTWVILIFVLVVSGIIFVMDWSVRGVIDIVIDVFTA